MKKEKFSRYPTNDTVLEWPFQFLNSIHFLSLLSTREIRCQYETQDVWRVKWLDLRTDLEHGFAIHVKNLVMQTENEFMTFSSNQGQENLGTVYSQRIRWDSSEPIIFNQTVSHSLRVALYTKMDPMAEVSSAFVSGPMLPRVSTQADIYVTPIRSKGFLLINCILYCNICIQTIVVVLQTAVLQYLYCTAIMEWY